MTAYLALHRDPQAVLDEAVKARTESDLIGALAARLGLTEEQASVIANAPFRNLSVEARNRWSERARHFGDGDHRGHA